MSQEPEEQQSTGIQKGARWLRIALLTLTTVGPVVKTIGGWLQQRSAALRETAVERGGKLVEAGQETAQSTQVDLQRRLDEFTTTSRQLAAEQARQLQKQARQLQAQTQTLRRALRDEARQRRQLQKVAQEVQRRGAAWSRDMLGRGEELTGNLVAQGGKISQEAIERGSAITHDLAKRGEQLLQPVRGRSRSFWTMLGFAIGLTGAATATYVLIRRRRAAAADEQDEQIELPARDLNSASADQSQPAGEIRQVDGDGSEDAPKDQEQTTA